MKKFLILLAAGLMMLSFSGTVLASDYYEFSQFSGAGAEYDVDSYGNTVYWKNGNNVWSIDVSVADMSKVNEPTASANYQTRTFSNPNYIQLSGPALLGASIGELYVDATSIYGAASNGNVYKFDKGTGAYEGISVTSGGTLTGGWGAGATFLSYGGGKWWAANENSHVYSSTGGAWTYEFTWPSMGGGHGDGMEYVAGHIFVSDMTSNYIAQWDQAADGSWSETERFAYTENVGNKYVEGMGFGALGHFWAGSGSYIYELGGGEIQDVIDDVVPEPATMLLFGVGLIGAAGMGRRKKS